MSKCDHTRNACNVVQEKVTYKTVHSAFPASQVHALWDPLALFARHLWAKSNLKSHIRTPCRSQYYWDLSLHYMRASLVAQTVKSLPAVQKTRVQSLGQEAPLEKEMTTHSSILAWKITWVEEFGRLQSMGSQRVRQDWATKCARTCAHVHTHTHTHTPVFCPGEFHGLYSPWGRKESDTTE